MYPLLEKVTESLNLAAENGVLGRRCLVSELRGDQVWFKYIFQHQSFWLKTEMCPRCAATSQSGPTCYLHYDAHLPLKTTDEFIREELPNDDKLWRLGVITNTRQQNKQTVEPHWLEFPQG